MCFHLLHARLEGAFEDENAHKTANRKGMSTTFPQKHSEKEDLMTKALFWLSLAIVMSLLAVTDPFMSTPGTKAVHDRLFKRDQTDLT
jgi:hypothetical protein